MSLLLEKKRKKIKKLLAKWQALFIQRDWQIQLNINEDEAWPNYADAGIQPGRRYAIITFSKNVPDKMLNRVACHEMLHIVMQPIQGIAEEWAGELSDDKKGLFEKQLEERLEVVVHNLEEVFMQLKL